MKFPLRRVSVDLTLQHDYYTVNHGPNRTHNYLITCEVVHIGQY